MLLEDVQNDISYRPMPEKLALYHGSKSGIKGRPRPDYIRARRNCDFGRGFYLGTNPQQVQTLVCRGENPTFYKVELDPRELNCVMLNGLTWAIFIGCKRGIFYQEDSPKLYELISNIDTNCDIIAGPIANDQIATVLNQFFNKDITDQALLACMRGMQLGTQYVMKTQRACDKVNITSEHVLSPSELQILVPEADKLRAKGNQLANNMRMRYRGLGQYLDQILEEGIEQDYASKFIPNPFV